MLIEDPSSPTQAMIMTNMSSAASGSNFSSFSVKRQKQKDPAKSPMLNTQADWSKID